MAVSFGGNSTATITAQNPSSITPAMPTGIAAGHGLILLIGVRSDTASVATPSGWDLAASLAGGGGTFTASAGPSRIYAFTRTATGSGDTLGAITLTGANMAWSSVIRLTNATGGWSFGAATGDDSVVGTAWSVTCSANPGLTAGDFTITGTCNGQAGTTWSAQAVSATGVSAWSAVTEVYEINSTAGSDINGYVAYHSVTTGTSTAAPVITATAAGTTTNTRGVSVIVRAREVVVAPTAVNAGADDSHPVNVAFTRTGTAVGATSYQWTLESGPGVTPGTVIDSDANLSWTPTATGTYGLRFKATNSAGTTTDDMTLTVVTPVSPGGTDRVASMTGVIHRVKAASLSATHGDAITTWTATVGSSPTGTGTYRTASAINNRPVIRFNGTSHTYTHATAHASVSTRTVGVVWSTETVTGDRELYAAGATELIATGTTVKVFGGTADVIGTGGVVAIDTPYVDTLTADAAANEVIYHNGTSIANGQAGTVAATTAMRVGSFGASSRWHDGDIAEMVIWDHVLDATERAAWHSYVQDAYGITVSDYVSLGGDAKPVTDTAAGTDAITVAATAPLTDAATGTDALTVTVQVPLTETGTATDDLSAATPPVSITLTDTGTGTDAIAVSATAPLAETSTGTDAVTIAARAPLTETPTGTDAITVSAAVTLTDTVTATDNLSVSVPAAISDSATVTDAVAVAARAPLAETATGTDALTITAKTIGLTETATGTDNLTTPARTIPLSENGTGTDALAITAKTIGLADDATGADSLFLSAQTKQLTDSATATDAFGLNGSANPVLTEIGTGTDALTVAVRVPIADTGTGSDAVTVKAGVALTDQGSVTDVIAVSAKRLPVTDDAMVTDDLSVGARVSLNETVTGTDALTVSVTIAKILTDSATITDALTTEQQNLRNVEVRFGAPRSRSLTVGHGFTSEYRAGDPRSRRLMLTGDPL
jgi:hypothetical protein